MHVGNVVAKSEESKQLDINVDKLVAIKQIVESALSNGDSKPLSLSVRCMVTKNALESVVRIAHVDMVRAQ